MKKLCILSFLFSICIASFAQNVEKFTVTDADLESFLSKERYKYPNFVSSRIYLNNGDTAFGRINLNYFDQTMRFINEKNDTVAISNQKDIKLITAGSDTFFYDNGFYEWAASSATIRLAIKHKMRLIERKPVGAFGTSSQAKNIQTVDKILGANSYDLSPNEEMVFSKETTYYISPINGLANNFLIVNKNNLKDLFPRKNVEGFIKENKINLNKEEDVIDVFIYLSKK